MDERIKRILNITLRSGDSAANLAAISKVMEKCQGAALGDGLYAYEPQRYGRCGAPYFSPNGTRRLAPYDNGLLLRVDCSNPKPRELGCKLELPFERFRVEVGFYHERVSRWREIVDFVGTFLRSKQYTN
jgi:hypothetical protein